jgi:hypothetical protein
MEAACSSETSVHTKSTQSHIPEDDILHSHSCENLKSYTDRIKVVQQLSMIIEYNNVFNLHKFTFPYRESVKFSADGSVRRRVQERTFYLMLIFYANLQTVAVVRQTDQYTVSTK